MMRKPFPTRGSLAQKEDVAHVCVAGGVACFT